MEKASITSNRMIWERGPDTCAPAGVLTGKCASNAELSRVAGQCRGPADLAGEDANMTRRGKIDLRLPLRNYSAIE
jgi:hypothetical protein